MSAYRSNSALVRKRFLKGVDGGLVAQAHVYMNAVKRALRGGYTSGDFVTGNVLNSVTRTDPRWESSARAIRVGTNVMYALFWEIGHHNIFTRRYERVEIWYPELIRTAPAQRQAFERVFYRIFGCSYTQFDLGFEAAD